jgi:hypothetical protein
LAPSMAPEDEISALPACSGCCAGPRTSSATLMRRPAFVFLGSRRAESTPTRRGSRGLCNHQIGKSADGFGIDLHRLSCVAKDSRKADKCRLGSVSITNARDSANLGHSEIRCWSPSACPGRVRSRSGRYRPRGAAAPTQRHVPNSIATVHRMLIVACPTCSG